MGRWRLLAPLEVLVVVPYFFSGERLSFLTALSWIAAFHLVWRPFRTSRRVVIAGVAIVSVALLYFYVIAYQKDATLDAYPEIRENVAVRQLEKLALPYLYSTANIPVFGRLTVDPLAPPTYGQLTVLPLVKVAHRVLPIPGAPPEYGGFYAIPFSSYNSATWLGPFFRDFGVVGCVALPAVVGFATTVCLIMGRIRRTLFSCWLAALGLSLIVFTPLKNQLQDAVTWELIVVGALGGILLPKREPSAGARATGLRTVPVRPLIAAGLTACIAGAGVAGLLTTASTGTGSAESASAVAKRLSGAAQRAVRAQEMQGPLSSFALASQLQVSDPASEYVPVSSGKALSQRAGIVGVASSGGSFRLGAITASSEAWEIIGVHGGGRYRVVGPRQRRNDLLVENGGFEDGLKAPWALSGGGGVGASRTGKARTGAFALELRYAGRRSLEASGVTQVVRELPERAPGTRYELTEVVLRSRLTRPVAVGFQYLYRDGTSQYIGGGVRGDRLKGRAGAPGIPAGSSRGWEVVTASGVASRRIAAIRIFAADAGRRALGGRIRVDSVKLAPSSRRSP